ncbi:hypothetical protein OSTOST_11805 [Ostertagia ostertagi]
MHEVTTAADKQRFLEVAIAIYKDDPQWIRPLDKDIEEVFDPQKNKFFKRGECTRWLLLDAQGQAIGRIAAFVNRQYKQEQPTGGIGFFECINDPEAARYMFDFCRQWLLERGMEAMDGPINFGERERWWGLLVEGFTPPLYGMNYHKPYYQALFEDYGFQLYFNQLCFGMKVICYLLDICNPLMEQRISIADVANPDEEDTRKNDPGCDNRIEPHLPERFQLAHIIPAMTGAEPVFDREQHCNAEQGQQDRDNGLPGDFLTVFKQVIKPEITQRDNNDEMAEHRQEGQHR